MRSFSVCMVALGLLALSETLSAEPLGTAFTYQGTLAQSGVPVNDICDFTFRIWDSETGGVEVGAPDHISNVQVTDGIFTVRLDYGGGIFEGDALWLEIAVGCPAGGLLAVLSPRQELTPTPNALFAPGSGSANTLDQAYDEGGSGAGRFIIADAGPVDITGNGGPAMNIVSDFDPALRVTSSSALGEDTGLEIVGARNGTTSADAAFIDLNDFDSNEGAGTEFTMARVGAGMADVSGQTGFLRFYTNAGADLQERMRIDKEGSVSIGSESGSERLKVAGDVSIGGGTAIGLHDGNSEYLRIRGRADDWYLGVRDAPTAPEHDFFIGLSEQDFTRFNFDRSGNLGLGTEPAADLHLAGTGSQQFRIEADTDNSGESDQPSIVMSQDGGINVTTIGYLDSRNHFSIRTNDSGSGATNILLEPEGRVGVGTASPQNTLDVQGPGTSAGGVSGVNNVIARFRRTDANASTAIAIDALSGEDAFLYFSDDEQATWSLGSVQGDPDLEPELRIRFHDPAGSSPTTVLRLTGPSVHPGQDNTVLLGFQGNMFTDPQAFKSVASYAFANVSDRRLKRDIQPLDYGIDEVMRLKPVRFHWKTSKDDREVLGVIAQDVYEVIPETVVGEPEWESGRLGVRYTELIPVLIRGMQDQQVQIEMLAEENAELRDRLSNLEALVFETLETGQ